MDTFKNPLETVQLIPIFNYLNILSDFLFIERYLEEIDQNKQIPVVNALNNFLHHEKNNKAKKVELIRTLLKGSDLYGENDDEYFDETFVNVMFNYIISSLVFDKYGNVYGFLADVFLQAESLQINEVLHLIFIHLEDATFENEYGDSSVLSFVSVSKIFNELILPLFPRSKATLSLLSLDYIYAQAGAMFLRPGRINTTYYKDFENSVSNLTKNELFDEYLATGHVIEKLILTEEKNLEMLKAFALPALTFYVFKSKYLFVYENMAHVISDSDFWHTAYKQLFQYITDIINNIKNELKNDYTLKMNVALANFQSTNAVAKTFMEHHCTHFDEKERALRLPFYLNYPTSFECKVGESLPSVEEYFKTQVNNIMKIYDTYEYQLLQEAFPKSLIEELETTQVIIKLFVPNNTVEGDFPRSQYLSYDFLEFYFPNNVTVGYYILKREDYSGILIDQVDVPQLFEKTTNLNFEKLYNDNAIKILKTTDENCSEFFRNFVKYKKSRLQSYLEILGDHQGNKLLTSDWWEEFGFSLVPYYPCLSYTSGNSRNNCGLNETKFFNKYQDESLKLISRYTRSFLSSEGTSIRSVLLRNLSYETVDEMMTRERKYRLSITDAVNRSGIFENIGQHLENPAFMLTFATKDDINVLDKIINSLKEKTNLTFTSVISSLSKISVLKSNFFRSIGTIGKNRSRLIFINTLHNKSDTGYGYKFIFLSDDISKIAQLRTDYEFKDKRLLLPISNSTKNEKKYIVLNNETFEPEPDQFMYEINNQLRWKQTKVLFSGIPIQDDDSDEKCSDDRYFEKWKHFSVCQRRQGFSEKTKYVEDVVEFVKKNTNFSETQIRNTLEKFIFPDNATLMQLVNHWLSNKAVTELFGSRSYIIDNPKLLSDLRYNLRFENHNVSQHDGTFRINSLYSKNDRRKIEEDASLETIVKDFNEQKATYSVTFHDYYAIRNFAATGYRRITRDTWEAKFMKSALYKLAIRQSDDPYGEFNLKLFRVESKPISVFTIKSSNQYIHLQKFTLAFPSIESAIRFAGYPAPGFVNIIYEMEFQGPYVRAKIEQFYEKKEECVILLPGSKFRIANGARVDMGELGQVLKLKLELNNIFYDKYLWYRNIMDEMARITF